MAKRCTTGNRWERDPSRAVVVRSRPFTTRAQLRAALDRIIRRPTARTAGKR